MAEELGTRDVLEQVAARLDNVERDIRELRDAPAARTTREPPRRGWRKVTGH